MKKKILNVGVDVDEILRMFTLQMIIEIRKSYPGKEVILPIQNYDMQSSFPWLTSNELVDFFNSKKAYEIYTEAAAFDGAADFCKAIQDMGHKVIIVTNQAKGNEHFTLEWLINRKHIPYDGIFFGKDKTACNLDIIVDDCTENLESFEHTDTIPIAMDRTWNRDWSGFRAKSFDEVLLFIERFGKLRN